MKITKAHCFFEQSGTFRDEFIKLGIPAEDYDIDNSYGNTDHVIDLFGEINAAYGGGTSVFDAVSKDDLIMAFFPCVRFSEQALLGFQGNSNRVSLWTDDKKLQYDLKLHDELHNLYSLISKMAIVVIQKGLRMVIENPYADRHYLKNYWCLKPQIIDKDRTVNGDYYKKPTQYFFIGCKPEQNFIFEPIEASEKKSVKFLKWNNDRQKERSLIHPQYARRFIKMYLMDADNYPVL